MEPITTALVAALGNLAEPAVRDAYDGLKSLLARKFGARHAVLEAVDQLERKPDSAGRRATLQEEVGSSQAAGDPDVLAAAQRLLESLQRISGSPVTVQQKVTGNHNIFTGTGDINLGGKPP